MSLILDALHRSENERGAAVGVPGIATEHQTAPVSSSRLTGGLLLLAVIALLAAAAWLLVDVSEVQDTNSAELQRQPAEPASSAADQPAARQSITAAVATPPMPVAVATPPMPAPVATPPMPVAVATPPMPAPVATYSKPEPTVQSVRPEPVAIVPIDTPLAAANARAVVAALYQQPTTVGAANSASAAVSETGTADLEAPAPTALDIDAIAAAAEQELLAVQASAAPVESQVELLEDLPQPFKDQVPSLYYSQHSWSLAPGQHFVVINGETRREGDRVARGVTLVEVLDGSSVFEFQQTLFRLRALNSWVNL